MKKREFHLGSGAALLILLFVITAMSILGLLSLMNARSDLLLARRSAQVAADMATLDAASEESFARLDAVLVACATADNGANDEEAFLSRVEGNLPEGMELKDRVVYWTEIGAEKRRLECATEILPMGGEKRIQWTLHRHWMETEGERE